MVSHAPNRLRLHGDRRSTCTKRRVRKISMKYAEDECVRLSSAKVGADFFYGT